jgi:hypothetical protein
MERARIMLIIAHAAIITVIHHAITGSATSIQINLPPKVVAITASLTESARTVIDQESKLLVVTTGLDLVPTNQACALLMSSGTMNTNAVVTRTNPTRLDTVQMTAKVLNIPTHVHNIETAINTRALNDANSIAIRDSPAVSTAINGRAVTLTAMAGSLAVMIVIIDHSVRMAGLIHGTHVGRAVLPGNATTIRADLENLPGVGQIRSYSKETTNILMQVTSRNPTRIKSEIL